MTRIKIMFVATVLAAACGKKASDPVDPVDEFTAAMAKLGQYTDQMCACTNAECAKKVDAEEDPWEKALKQGKKPTDSQLGEWTKAKAAYKECRDKAGNAAPAAPPPPPTSSALDTTNRVADGMCACTDAACAQQVLQANAEAMGKLRGYQPASTEEGNALMLASKRMADCAAKIPAP
jgi:hypothetical protein